MKPKRLAIRVFVGLLVLAFGQWIAAAWASGELQAHLAASGGICAGAAFVTVWIIGALDIAGVE